MKKKIQDEILDALKFAYNYHVKKLQDLYGSDVSVTQEHDFMAEKLRAVIENAES